MLEQVSAQVFDLWSSSLPLAQDLLQNKWARAAGMMALVWFTIWVIALVYSGYTRDSVLGPVGLRPHTNRRLGGDKIVVDQTLFPFQMDGVEATCRFYYVYEDRDGKTRRIPLDKPDSLQLHIRVSPIPRDARAQYGFESDGEIGDLSPELVVFPTLDPQAQPPPVIEPTPPTVSDYIAAHDLVAKWTDDDEAPIISIGSARLDLLALRRADYILTRARRLEAASKGGFLSGLGRSRYAKERANIFGSYYVRMQFSKNPWFVLFRHPNRDLKMTAWLTVLTSFFAIAMDLWPVEPPERRVPVAAESAQSERPAQQARTIVRPAQ